MADAEASAHLTSSGFEVLRSVFQWAGTAKWSRWRAAERDIIQHHSLEAGRAVCLRGVGGGEGTPPTSPSLPLPPKHQASHTAPMNGQWLSINLPSQLVSLPETNYNVHLEAI